MKLFILLPCFNESQSLPSLLCSIHKVVSEMNVNYEIIVVNDGSSDNTSDVAVKYSKEINIKILEHDKNKGLGEAIKTGLSYFYALGVDDSAAVIMDADNTHNPNLIPKMFDALFSGSDVVIASRYEKGGEEIGLSFLRKLFSLGANTLLSICFHLPYVKDYTCGYRMYSGNSIKKVISVYGDEFVTEKGFTCMAELLVKLYYSGCRISEVPLVLRYDLKSGESKMKAFKTIIRYFALIHKLRRHPEINDTITNAGEGSNV